MAQGGSAHHDRTIPCTHSGPYSHNCPRRHTGQRRRAPSLSTATPLRTHLSAGLVRGQTNAPEEVDVVRHSEALTFHGTASIIAAPGPRHCASATPTARAGLRRRPGGGGTEGLGTAGFRRTASRTACRGHKRLSPCGRGWRALRRSTRAGRSMGAKRRHTPYAAGRTAGLSASTRRPRLLTRMRLAGWTSVLPPEPTADKPAPPVPCWAGKARTLELAPVKPALLN